MTLYSEILHLGTIIVINSILFYLYLILEDKLISALLNRYFVRGELWVSYGSPSHKIFIINPKHRLLGELNLNKPLRIYWSPFKEILNSESEKELLVTKVKHFRIFITFTNESLPIDGSIRFHYQKNTPVDEEEPNRTNDNQ